MIINTYNLIWMLCIIGCTAAGVVLFIGLTFVGFIMVDNMFRREYGKHILDAIKQALNGDEQE